jgi:hypothetical protein
LILTAPFFFFSAGDLPRMDAAVAEAGALVRAGDFEIFFLSVTTSSTQNLLYTLTDDFNFAEFSSVKSAGM